MTWMCGRCAGTFDDPDLVLCPHCQALNTRPIPLDFDEVEADAASGRPPAAPPAAPPLPATTPPSPGEAALVGQVLGGCRLEALLGRGGMSATYRGRHEALDLPAVVKTLDPAKAWGRPGLVEAFLREGKALAQILHPHVVRVLSAGASEGRVPFLVLELVQGRSLRVRLRREGPPSPAEAARLVREASLGLGAAHELGIVHGDVKPENLLLGDGGRVKVVDFGLARETGEEAQPGFVQGTPAYMAPEVCRGGPVDPRSDVYALGVTLFELLLDRWPFNAPEPALLLRKHLEEAPPLAELEAAGVPRALVDLVGRCLAKDAAARPADGAELARLLEPLTEAGVAAAGAPAPRLAKRRRRGRRSASSARRSGLGRRSSAHNSAVRRRSSTGSLGTRSSGHQAARRGGDGVGLALGLALACALIVALVLVLLAAG